MNIVPANNNVSMQGAPQGWKNFKKRVTQKILDTLPSSTYEDSAKKLERWNKFNERMSRPAENRAIMGATAILAQPGIDALNPNTDDETRLMSVVKDVSKIGVGTTVGICVRGSVYKLVEKFTNPLGKTKHSKSLLPSKYIEELAKNPAILKNYRSALSTAMALCVMLFTNFAIDMPLTLLLTNLLADYFKLYKNDSNRPQKKALIKDIKSLEKNTDKSKEDKGVMYA